MIHITYAILNEYKAKHKRYVLGTKSMWRQHINVLKWVENILVNNIQIGTSFNPTSRLLTNIMCLICELMHATISTISNDVVPTTHIDETTTMMSSMPPSSLMLNNTTPAMILNSIIKDVDLYFLLRLANDERLKLLRPHLCNVISNILCTSDHLSEIMATKETILELMALTLFADNDANKESNTVTNLNVQLCLALILRSASKATIQIVMTEKISLIKEFFEYVHNKIVNAPNNTSSYKGYCMILSAIVMCICKTTKLGRHRKTIYKTVFNIIETTSLRSSWMKHAAFSLWLVTQDEHQSRLLISEHHPPADHHHDGKEKKKEELKQDEKKQHDVNILESIIEVLSNLTSHFKRAPKKAKNNEVGRAKHAAF